MRMRAGAITRAMLIFGLVARARHASERLQTHARYKQKMKQKKPTPRRVYNTHNIYNYIISCVCVCAIYNQYRYVQDVIELHFKPKPGAVGRSVVEIFGGPIGARCCHGCGGFVRLRTVVRVQHSTCWPGAPNALRTVTMAWDNNYRHRPSMH